MGNSTLAIFRMSVWFRYAVAIAGFALAIGATAPSWAQAIAPAPVNPQAAPAVESTPLEPSVTVERAAGAGITWSVVNRFRLFRGERDFRGHAEAAQGRAVLEAEHAVAAGRGGGGWARDMGGRLCLDRIGQIADQCVRDDVAENYLNPADHAIEVQLAGILPPAATCTWSFGPEGDAVPTTASAECGAPVRTRVPYGKPTKVTVDLTTPGEPVRRATADIAVRDLLIAGLGDSVASGDGNPDRPVALADEGFCFRRFLGPRRAEYFRPGRVGFSGARACDADNPPAATARSERARRSPPWITP